MATCSPLPPASPWGCCRSWRRASTASIRSTSRLTLWQVEAAALLLPGLAIGARFSQIAHADFDKRWLRIFVLGFAIVSGLLLMVH
jgi:uncharacterized protein